MSAGNKRTASGEVNHDSDCWERFAKTKEEELNHAKNNGEFFRGIDEAMRFTGGDAGAVYGRLISTVWLEPSDGDVRDNPRFKKIFARQIKEEKEREVLENAMRYLHLLHDWDDVGIPGVLANGQDDDGYNSA